MDAPSRSPFGPLTAWAAPQLAVLALMAGQVPWLPLKSMSRPAELMALHVMLVVQFTVSAALLPLLFRDLRTSLLVVFTAMPMTLLAMFLTGEPSRWKMVYASGCMAAWLVGLALWGTVLRSRRAAAIGAGIALLLLFGGLVAWYVRAEYGIGGGQELRISPLIDAMNGAKNGALTATEWSRVIAFTTVGAIAALIQMAFRRKTR